VANIITEH